MTTKSSGGSITGNIALTLEATVALELGDPVELSGDYTCIKAAGANPVLGVVSVANKTRSGGTFPASQIPGDVTVEARGFGVVTVVAAATIAAGDEVGADASGEYAPVGAGVSKAGIALTGAAATERFDLLLQ